MFGLKRVLFGTSQDLDSDAADLLTPTNLQTVLERHRAGNDPEISHDQQFVLFYEGQSPQTESAHVRDSEDVHTASAG
jgi:hypothetical protein